MIMLLLPGFCFNLQGDPSSPVFLLCVCAMIMNGDHQQENRRGEWTLNESFGVARAENRD